MSDVVTATRFPVVTDSRRPAPTRTVCAPTRRCVEPAACSHSPNAMKCSQVPNAVCARPSPAATSAQRQIAAPSCAAIAPIPRPITSGSMAPGNAQSAPVSAARATVQPRARISASTKRPAVSRAGSCSVGKGYVAESTIPDGKPRASRRRPNYPQPTVRVAEVRHVR